MYSRRQFMQSTLAAGSALLLPALGLPRLSIASESPLMTWGEGELFSLSDGQLSLPLSLILPESIDKQERQAFLQERKLDLDRLTPDCNVTLWRQAERLILFDTGAGPQFAAGGGQLADSLAMAGIDPADITDVVFTHAHPDHIWGVIDDFDEVAFPNAAFYMPETEWNYWLDPNTLSRTPDARKSFVVGAQNRLPLIEERMTLFKAGDEILPNIEVVDSSGHTPGHSSFVLHDGDDSLVVVGDAISNAHISFERPRWPSGTDQDAQQGIQTRLALLDRFSQGDSLLLGFHLPAPGIGRVERQGDTFRFAPIA